MRCEEFEERIHESLDQRIAPWSQEPLLHHAQKCSGCHDLLDTYEHMSDGLGFFENAKIGSGFAERVVEQFSAVRRRRRRAAIVATAAVLAAAVLAAVLPGFLWQSAPVDVASPDRIAPDEGATGGDPPVAAEPRTAPGGAPAGQSNDVDIEDINIERAHVFWDQWAARLSTDQWKPVDRIAGEIAPITEPLSVAIEEIRSTIPLGRTSRTADSSSDSAGAWFVPAARDTA